MVDEKCRSSEYGVSPWNTWQSLVKLEFSPFFFTIQLFYVNGDFIIIYFYLQIPLWNDSKLL